MVEETFDAAHALRGYEGPCENLHGHTWRVQLFLQGEELNKLGLLIDFKTIKEKLKKFLDRFDHHNLNDLAEFKKSNPSSENLAKLIFKKIKKDLPQLIKTVVWESATTCASYTD